MAPSNVECKTLESKSIQIRWLQLSQDQLRGKLIAYKVVFQDVEQVGSVNGKKKIKLEHGEGPAYNVYHVLILINGKSCTQNGVPA